MKTAETTNLRLWIRPLIRECFSFEWKITIFQLGKQARGIIQVLNSNPRWLNPHPLPFVSRFPVKVFQFYIPFSSHTDIEAFAANLVKHVSRARYLNSPQGGLKKFGRVLNPDSNRQQQIGRSQLNHHPKQFHRSHFKSVSSFSIFSWKYPLESIWAV